MAGLSLLNSHPFGLENAVDFIIDHWVWSDAFPRDLAWGWVLGSRGSSYADDGFFHIPCQKARSSRVDTCTLPFPEEVRLRVRQAQKDGVCWKLPMTFLSEDGVDGWTVGRTFWVGKLLGFRFPFLFCEHLCVSEDLCGILYNWAWERCSVLPWSFSLALDRAITSSIQHNLYMYCFIGWWLKLLWPLAYGRAE